MTIEVEYQQSVWQLPVVGHTKTGVQLGSHDRWNIDHVRYCSNCIAAFDPGEGLDDDER